MYANFMGGQTANPEQFGAMAQPAMPGATPPPVNVPGAPAGPSAGQMDPQTLQALQQLIALQSQTGRRSSANKQMALADQLRADANSQLSGRRVGIANVGAAALNGYLAGQQMREAAKTNSVLDDERVKASQGLIDALRSGAKF